jgi:electron transfer flavoprotein alpha subunit
MKALVFLEHRGDQLSKGSLGVLTKAVSLGQPVGAVIVGGPEVRDLAAQAGAFGAHLVHLASDAAFAAPLPQPRVDALASVVRAHGYDTVLFANSVLTGDVAGALAVRLDAGLNWDLIDLDLREDELVATRPCIADSILVEVGWRSDVRLALFRAGSFEAVSHGGGDVQVSEESVEPAVHSLRAQLVEQSEQADERASSLEDAEVIVSGGMGLGGPEHFALAEELAKTLDGSVGATRAAVYAGWYPYATQIGQTGKTVAPKLYIALGISGAIQHKVGMQNAKTIVAINTDPAAPIFEFSDLAVVGDLHVIVPELIELVRQHRTAAG